MSSVLRVIYPVIMFCPHCGSRHVDKTRETGRWDRQGHTTHKCEECDGEWEAYCSGSGDADADDLRTAVDELADEMKRR